MSCETCQVCEPFTRRIILKAGEEGPDHMHVIDHISRVSAGSVFLKAYASGQLRIEGTFIAPVDIFINKEWNHKFKALEDAVIECIFDWKGDIALTGPVL